MDSSSAAAECVTLMAAGGAVIHTFPTGQGNVVGNPIATLFPEDGGYAPLFFGHVVDMLQFPMLTWVWPSWMPWIGGQSFTFFEPVFNLADTAISTGVGIILVFNKRIFPKS